MTREEFAVDYVKAVEVANLRENAEGVLRSVDGLTTEDAMNALGAAVSHLVLTNWAQAVRGDVLEAWFSMVRGSLAIADQ